MKLTCSKCKQTKPAEEFMPDKRRKSGRGSHCRICHASYYQRRPAVHPLAPSDEKTCSTCKQIRPVSEFRQSSRYRTGYVSCCKECQRKSARDWKRRNKERMREYNARQRAEHPERSKRWWASLTGEKRQRYLKDKRRRANTPKGRLYSLNRFHQRRSLIKKGDVTPKWIKQLRQTQTHCAYCGCKFTADLRSTIDHVIPISKGGTHTKDNIVLACQSCNSSKGNRILESLPISFDN